MMPPNFIMRILPSCTCSYFFVPTSPMKIVSKTTPRRPQLEALFSTVVTVPVVIKICKKFPRTKHFHSLPISEQNEFKVL